MISSQPQAQLRESRPFTGAMTGVAMLCALCHFGLGFLLTKANGEEMAVGLVIKMHPNVERPI